MVENYYQTKKEFINSMENIIKNNSPITRDQIEYILLKRYGMGGKILDKYLKLMMRLNMIYLEGEFIKWGNQDGN